MGGSLKHNADGTVTVKFLTSRELLTLRDFMKARCKQDKRAVGFYCMLNDVCVKTMTQPRVEKIDSGYSILGLERESTEDVMKRLKLVPSLPGVSSTVIP